MSTLIYSSRKIHIYRVHGVFEWNGELESALHLVAVMEQESALANELVLDPVEVGQAGLVQEHWLQLECLN